MSWSSWIRAARWGGADERSARRTCNDERAAWISLISQVNANIVGRALLTVDVREVRNSDSFPAAARMPTIEAITLSGSMMAFECRKSVEREEISSHSFIMDSRLPCMSDLGSELSIHQLLQSSQVKRISALHQSMKNLPRLMPKAPTPSNFQPCSPAPDGCAESNNEAFGRLNGGGIVYLHQRF